MDGDPLDLYDHVKFKNRYAIAQFWDDGDIEAFHAFQEQVKTGKSNKKPLDSTFLASEVAHDGFNKLIKCYSPQGKMINSTFLKRVGCDFHEGTKNSKFKTLDYLLKKYNSTCPLPIKKKIPCSLKSYFENLGYRVSL